MLYLQTINNIIMPQYNSFGMSPIRRRNPIGLNIGAFADVVGKLDAKYQQMAQQQSAIDMALAQLPVNAAEDEWKYNLGNELRNQIESVENPNDRYLTSIRAAGQLMSRPDVVGRIRAQAEYDNFVKQTQARKDLTEDDKAWALANNPYNYTDVRDDKGNIIGGSEWKPTKSPTGIIDYNAILSNARQLVFKETGSSSNIIFHDAEGNQTNDPTKIRGIMYTKDGQWQGIDENKLKNIIESAIDNTPGARARLDQDWEVANWKYNQMTPEEQENNKPSELFASNGKKYSKQEWYNNKFDRAIDSMSGMNYSSSIKYDDNYFNYMNAVRATNSKNGIGLNNGGYNDNLITSLGAPAIIETEDTVNKAFGKVSSGIQELENVIPELKNNSLWKNAKKNNNYNQLANIIEGSTQIPRKHKDNMQFINSVLRDLRENADIVESLGIEWKDKIDSLSFNGAFTTGGELPENAITKKYMQDYNAFGGSDAVSLQYSFKDYNELSDFATKAGINLQDNSIVNIGNDNGLPTITIRKSNPINYRALKLYSDLGYQGRSTSEGFFDTLADYIPIPFIGDPKRTGVKGVTANGTIRQNGGAAGVLNRMSSLVNEAQKEANNVIGDKASGKAIITTKNMQLPGVAAALSEENDDKRAQKINIAVDNVVNAINGMHGSQYEIQMIDPKTNTLTSSNIKDKTQVLEDIKSYIESNRSNAKDFLGLKIEDGKIGYRIQINKNYNKTKNAYVDGDIEPNEIVIFGPDDPLLNRMQNDNIFQAQTKYERLDRINNSKSITFDNNVIKFTNKGTTINEKPASKEEAVLLIAKDLDYNVLKRNINSQNYNRGVAQFVETYYGFSPDSDAGRAKIKEITNQINNELRL